jgi:hypothetical protein
VPPVPTTESIAHRIQVSLTSLFWRCRHHFTLLQNTPTSDPRIGAMPVATPPRSTITVGPASTADSITFTLYGIFKEKLCV